MAKQFLYASLVLSSILLVSVSASIDYEEFAKLVTNYAAILVARELPDAAKLYIENKVLHDVDPEDSLLFDAALINLIASDISPRDKIIAYYAQHELDSGKYSSSSTLHLINMELLNIDLHSKYKWEMFRDTLALQ
ncbi:uncharacterized protein LOC120346772 [Styela clava]